jgi:hypothetical protein
VRHNTAGLILLIVIVASSDMGQVIHHLRKNDYRYFVFVILLIIPQGGLRA